MTLTVDPDHLGTPEVAWRRSGRLARLAEWWPDLWPGRVVVVAPHPDDEILGAAGILRRASALRVPVEVVSVTDGEAARRPAGLRHGVDLRDVREREARKALRRLGVACERIRLGLPDGAVAEHERELAAFLVTRLRRGDLCVVPWTADGHPDHDACGRAAAIAASATGAQQAAYLVWAWHWADPECDDLPWDQLVRLPLDGATRRRKRRAVAAHSSQLTPTVAGIPDSAVLPPDVVEHFRRPYEVYALDSRNGR